MEPDIYIILEAEDKTSLTMMVNDYLKNPKVAGSTVKYVLHGSPWSEETQSCQCIYAQAMVLETHCPHAMTHSLLNCIEDELIQIKRNAGG